MSRLMQVLEKRSEGRKNEACLHSSTAPDPKDNTFNAMMIVNTQNLN